MRPTPRSPSKTPKSLSSQSPDGRERQARRRISEEPNIGGMAGPAGARRAVLAMRTPERTRSDLRVLPICPIKVAPRPCRSRNVLARRRKEPAGPMRIKLA